jgi:hypothetical protein
MFDTTKIIERLSRQIAMTVLADFIMLGHEKVGSFSLSDDKTEMFSTALGAWLNEIAEVFNRHAIPRLYRLNAMNLTEQARIAPGDIEQRDLQRFAEAVERLTASGYLTPGSEADEDFVRSAAGMPPTPVDLREELEDEEEEEPVPPNPEEEPEEGAEEPPEEEEPRAP